MGSVTVARLRVPALDRMFWEGLHEGRTRAKAFVEGTLIVACRLKNTLLSAILFRRCQKPPRLMPPAYVMRPVLPRQVTLRIVYPSSTFAGCDEVAEDILCMSMSEVLAEVISRNERASTQRVTARLPASCS